MPPPVSANRGATDFMLTSKHVVTLDENHIYRVDGTIESGFTEICVSQQVGKKPCPECAKGVRHQHDGNFYTEEGREEGNALHAWLLFLAQGNKPEVEPDERIRGRVEGIKKFLRESGLVLAGGEVPLFDPINRFCVTPDIFGYIGNVAWVIDAKRGGKLKIHELQTAAQKIALPSIGFHAERRGSLYLKDGDYRLPEHKDRDDEKRWKAIVSAHHSKQFYI